ncbi:hypothetical protein L0F63_003611 [Massospora cicadina]|nr:hypothetical protein L0F63_003611 [Massospora cicadina]
MNDIRDTRVFEEDAAILAAAEEEAPTAGVFLALLSKLGLQIRFLPKPPSEDNRNFPLEEFVEGAEVAVAGVISAAIVVVSVEDVAEALVIAVVSVEDVAEALVIAVASAEDVAEALVIAVASAEDVAEALVIAVAFVVAVVVDLAEAVDLKGKIDNMGQ